MEVLTMEEVMALPKPAPQWGGWKLRKTTIEYKPYADRAYVYPVDLEKFTDSAKVLDTIAQVAEKTWATNECLGGLVHAINDILRLQGRLCGSGVDKTLLPSEIRRIVKQRETS